MVQQHGRKFNRRVAASNNLRGPCQRQQRCKHQWLHGANDWRIRVFSFLQGSQAFGPDWMPWGKKAEEDSVPPATQAATQSAVSICCVVCTIQLSVVGNAEGARGISAMCVLVGQHVMLTHACVGQVCARVRAHPHPHARLFARC